MTEINFVSLDELKDITQNTADVIITSQQIFDLYPEIFQAEENKLIVLPQSPNYKTGEYFIYLCNELAKRQVGKSAHLVGIGGGNITDLTGFVAAVYMRGIKVSFVPTTLLAMVDAAIGGKNAIDIGNIKNIIGSVHMPQNVFIYKNFIATTSQTEILSGMAEAIKIGLLFDKSLLDNCLQVLADVKMTDVKDNSTIPILPQNDLLHKVILQSGRYKMNIVEKDMFSVGKRHLLNFGHTIGHALELKHHLPHGWAVALGMIIETAIACELKLTSPNILSQIRDIILTYYHFDTVVPNFNWNSINIAELARMINFDKKITNSNIQLPVIVDIGKAELSLQPLATICSMQKTLIT